MSFAAIQARLMMLISMQYDIELQTQFIMQHKLFLSKASQSFINLKADYEPGSKADRILEARIHQLNEAEKILDIRIQGLQRRAQAIAQEREGVSKLLEKNTQQSFGKAWASQ
jgi:hypothetical protein